MQGNYARSSVLMRPNGAAQDPREVMDVIGELLDAGAPCSRLAGEMSRLIEMLRGKFDADQQNGTFEEAAFALPCLTGPIESMLHQRKALVMALLDLNRRLHDGTPPIECREALRPAFERFVEQYLENETMVHHLLEEAYIESDWG